MDKAQTPPSGDKHDYLSYGPYWWPDPDAPDGLPWVRRDGLCNPDTIESDYPALQALMREVQTLSLAYFYGGDETLARAATERLRAWFIEPRTRMNPHLNYGQAVPGVCEGRGIGIIDTVVLRWLPDIMEMLRDSTAWSTSDETQIKSWLSDYLGWLLESKCGRDEAKQHNNHGSWYDVQVAALGLFTGNRAAAERVLEQAPAKRFGKHIESDGSQPFELRRTRSFSYSCYNLTALFDLARLGESVGLNLWNWRGENGASLSRALEFLAPYADANKEWPREQVIAKNGDALAALLRRASLHLPQGEWRATLEIAEQTYGANAQLQLLWPLR